MFSFFHRTPVIHLDCFTHYEQVYNLTPIVKSAKVHPKWWKELPKNYPEIIKKDDDSIFEFRRKQNLKDCYAYLELFNNSFCIRHWTDLYLEIDETTYKYYTASCGKPNYHTLDEYENGFKNYHHIKLVSPWAIREKTGVKFSWFGAEWNLDNYDFKVLPGIINFYVNASTNVNIMLPKRKNSYIIPAGLPLVNIVPLFEKKFTIKNHLVSEKEFNQRMFDSHSYFNGWRAAEKLFRENKCPFGFGD